MTSGKNFQRMRRIDARRGTENFKALFSTEFELLTKNHQGGPFGPPPIRSRVNPRPAGPSPAPTLCWGGRSAPPPHLSRKPTDVGGKFKRQWKGLDEIFQMKFKNLTSGSPVTSQVRSNTKCLAFSIYVCMYSYNTPRSGSSGYV